MYFNVKPGCETWQLDTKKMIKIDRDKEEEREKERKKRENLCIYFCS